jgi:hypothetical protein
MIGLYKAEKGWEPRPLLDFEIEAFKEYDAAHPFGDFKRTHTTGTD